VSNEKAHACVDVFDRHGSIVAGKDADPAWLVGDHQPASAKIPGRLDRQGGLVTA